MCGKKNLVVIIKNLFNPGQLEENTYVIAKVNELIVSYTDTDLTDSHGNVIGSSKFSLNTLVKPGAINVNYSTVYKFNQHQDEYFAYVQGIREYILGSGGPSVAYENDVVTSFVKNGKVIDGVTLNITLSPGKDFLINDFVFKC